VEASAGDSSVLVVIVDSWSHSRWVSNGQKVQSAYPLHTKSIGRLETGECQPVYRKKQECGEPTP
jgi:hypothetical protein